MLPDRECALLALVLTLLIPRTDQTDIVIRNMTIDLTRLCQDQNPSASVYIDHTHVCAMSDGCVLSVRMRHSSTCRVAKTQGKQQFQNSVTINSGPLGSWVFFSSQHHVSANCSRDARTTLATSHHHRQKRDRGAPPALNRRHGRGRAYTGRGHALPSVCGRMDQWRKARFVARLPSA